MKVTFSKTKMIFSNNLEVDAKIKKGGNIFPFRIAGTDEFGFQVAEQEQSEYMICAEVKENPDSGKLYIEPTDPPVGLMLAVMRLNGKRRITLKVEKQPVKETFIYVIKKPTE